MYPLNLIPIMVKGVPSAHMLINSIGDLLTGANLKRRIFAVNLMAELIEKVYKFESKSLYFKSDFSTKFQQHFPVLD